MKNLKLIYLLLFLFALVSCKKEENTTSNSALNGLTKLTEGYATGASTKVEIWGEKSFFTGYNKLTLVLYDSTNPSQKITDADIQFEPMMTMVMDTMTEKHSAPVENPDKQSVNGVFKGAIVFIMPSSNGNTWKLKVAVNNLDNGKEGEADFDINVGSPKDARVISFISQTADSSKLFVSMVQPDTPTVGINTIEFTIHKMESMMSFVPVDSCTIKITPEMPSMGHGSPNNVNPVDAGDGHYKGKVNFTMTGWWRINLTIMKGDEIVTDKAYFDVNFQ